MKTLRNSVAVKGVALVATLAMMLALPFGVGVQDTHAQTVAELLAQIEALQAQLLALQGGGTSCPAIAQPLTIGSQGEDVVDLQNYLTSTGHFTFSGGSTGYFGPITQSALAAWQADNGVAPAVGYWGPISQAKYNSVCMSSDDGDDGDDDDADDGDDFTLEGGAGSLDDVDYVAGLNNEEVGEDEEDAEVAGLDIEADGSDIEIIAVDLDFTAGTAGSGSSDDDLDDYASEVSVWLDGEELARMDADEFTDDDNFDKNVTLDRGGIIRDGERGDLVVAVSGIGNLDSANVSKTWTLQFDSVRFRDATGAVISDSTTGDIGGTARTFSFESFATAASVELKVTETSSDVNDAQTVGVDDTDDTDRVAVLEFEMEAEGDSDLDIDDIPVNATSSGAGVGEIINKMELEIDGEEVDSESVSSTTDTTRTITFDDIDYVLDAGDTVTVVIYVDVNDTGGAFGGGDTLKVGVNPDDSGWDVEDESGEDLAASDKTGTAESDTHTFYEDGLNIADPSSSVSVKDTNGDTAGGEQGQYEIEFELTAFGDDIYVPFGATITTSSVDTDDGVSYAIENSDGDQVQLNSAGTASTTAVVDGGSADTSGSYWVVREGQTETFTLNVTLTPLADGFFRMQLHGVNFNVGSAAVADTLQLATPASDFDTSYADLDA